MAQNISFIFKKKNLFPSVPYTDDFSEDLNFWPVDYANQNDITTDDSGTGFTVNINTGSSSEISAVTYLSKYRLSGDFDISLDFDISTTGTPNLNDYGIFYLSVGNRGDSYGANADRVEIRRVYSSGSDNDFRLVNVDNGGTFELTRDQSSLTNFTSRIVRSGNSFSFYYDETLLGTTSRTLDSEVDILFLTFRRGTIDMSCNYNNFKINSGTVIY